MVGHESVRVKRKTGHKHEKHFIEEITVRQIGKKQYNGNTEFIQGM